MYTPEEKADIQECYFSSNKSPELALRSYVTKFPPRRHPEKKIFDRVYQCFRRNQSSISKCLACS